jgi:hypothetical protein
VTSFRPKNPLLPDDSVLRTIRGISDINEVYFEFGEYRLEMLEERIRDKLKEMRKAHGAGKSFDTDGFKRFLETSIAHLDRTNTEMVRNEEVVHGFVPGEDLPNLTPTRAKI